MWSRSWRRRRGDIVIMDNVQTHNVDGVRQAVEAVGARLLYLPAYSPDLNLIEQAFVLKRSCEKPAPELGGPSGAPFVKPLLHSTLDECANFLAGYACWLCFKLNGIR